MNPAVLELLCCPDCSGALRLEDARMTSGRVESGRLTCENCASVYPIRGCIPRFIERQAFSSGVQGKTAANFGDAWTVYAEKRAVNPYTEEQFLDWIEPLAREDFRDKNVLDLGSGLGGFSSYAAGFGARQVVGLELSHAVDASAALLRDQPNLNFIQADLLRPPLRRASFDLVYSIGVLHHLEKPRDGFHQAAALARIPSGRVFIWVYGRENNGWVVHVVDPLRKLASRLPVPAIRWGLAFPLSLLLFPLLHTCYSPGLPSALRAICRRLPYHAYFQWLRKYGFSYVVGMVTDQLIPPRTFYLRREELVNWFASENLTIESMTQRNGMSWRVLGQPTR